jgi:hypothetical protein
MKVSRLFPVVALSMAAAGGCTDQVARDQITALREEFNEYKRWLGQSEQDVNPSDTTVTMWFGFVRTAICNLENKVNPPIGDTLCHGDAAHGTAPNPPPFL